MAKRKRTKAQTTIYKTPYRKLKIEQYEPASLVTSVVLNLILKWHHKYMFLFYFQLKKSTVWYKVYKNPLFIESGTVCSMQHLVSVFMIEQKRYLYSILMLP
jgi:hypothetical protein